MLNRAELTRRIKEAGVIAIIRADSPDKIPQACDAIAKGGMTVLEITLTTPKAFELIREVSCDCEGKILVGAGSVIDSGQCKAAIAAGAQFIVSPVGKIEVLETAHRHDKPVMLGAYTPSEAQAAHEAGSDFIKIFPADKLGPSYIKAIRAPLPHLQIVPTGGVDTNTAIDFMKAGCAALGVGSSLLPNEALKYGNWEIVTNTAAKFVSIVKEFRGSR